MATVIDTCPFCNADILAGQTACECGSYTREYYDTASRMRSNPHHAKPVPRTEHAFRQHPPSRYARFASSSEDAETPSGAGQAALKAKGIRYVFGFPRDGGGAEVQSVKFKADQWTIPAAQKWLKEHDMRSDKYERAQPLRSNPHRSRRAVGRGTCGCCQATGTLTTRMDVYGEESVPCCSQCWAVWDVRSNPRHGARSNPRHGARKNPHRGPGSGDFTREEVDQLVQMEGETNEIPGWKNCHATEETIRICDQFEDAVMAYLEDWCEGPRAKKDRRLQECSAAGIFQADAPYAIFMTIEGHGVGIWDGRWEHLLPGSSIDDMHHELQWLGHPTQGSKRAPAKALHAAYDAFKDALIGAAMETHTPGGARSARRNPLTAGAAMVLGAAAGAGAGYYYGKKSPSKSHGKALAESQQNAKDYRQSYEHERKARDKLNKFLAVSLDADALAALFKASKAEVSEVAMGKSGYEVSAEWKGGLGDRIQFFVNDVLVSEFKSGAEDPEAVTKEIKGEWKNWKEEPGQFARAYKEYKDVPEAAKGYVYEDEAE